MMEYTAFNIMIRTFTDQQAGFVELLKLGNDELIGNIGGKPENGEWRV